MKINTTALNQLKAFNDFAKDFRANKDAVAKLGTASADGAVSSIAQNLNDKSRAFTRTNENKKLNNATRDLFMATIAKLFGGKDNIPDDVLKAMHIKRFGGDGRPLTARRITEVNIAVIKSLRTREAEGVSDQNGNKLSADSVEAAINGEEWTQTNKNILECLNNYDDEESIESLPDDIQGALSAMKETINTRCGAGTVEKLGDVLDLLGPVPRDKLVLLSRGLVRDLNRDDIITAFNETIKKEPMLERAKLLERIEQLANNDVKGADVTAGALHAMLEEIPGLLDELKACKLPDDYKRTLDKYEPEIKARMEIDVVMSQCEKKAVSILYKEFKEMTGLDPTKLKPPLSTYKYETSDIPGLKNDIRQGKVRVTSADDVQNAFVDFARNFIQSRLDHWEKLEVEFKDQVPKWTLEHLRQCALTVPHTKQLLLGGAKYLSEIDIQPLKDAISAKKYDRNDVAMKTYDFLLKIYDITKKLLGPEIPKWGPEDLIPFSQLMIKAALAKDPELVKAIMPHIDEIQVDVITYIHQLSTAENEDVKKTLGPATGFSNACVVLYDAMPQGLK